MSLATYKKYNKKHINIPIQFNLTGKHQKWVNSWLLLIAAIEFTTRLYILANIRVSLSLKISENIETMVQNSESVKSP